MPSTPTVLPRLPRGWRGLCRWLAVSTALALLAGCGMLELRRQSAAYYDATVLVGRITVPDEPGSAVVAAALDARSGAVVHRTWLHESGSYELIVPRGEYRVAACADRNRNGACDADEPAGRYEGGRAVAASGTGVVAMLDFALDGPADRGLPTTPPAGPLHSTQVGALLDLDGPAASAAAGEAGYWRPMDYFQRWGGNLYALGPYDPGRVPVVLVHGAAGSPQDWRWFIDHLDRRRYQPWVYAYPSGASVDSMAHLLYWKLFNAQLRYRPERLVIVAHSMGGLVTRRFLTQQGAQFPQITDYVTLSTPWGGEATAELGVQHSPAVVPSWRDLQPDGPMLRSLFEQPLPPQLRHTLLFSHRGGYSLLRPNHDGTVTLASQLRSAAQAQAVKVLGFDEDHVSILAAPAVLAEVGRALAEGDRQVATQRVASGHVALDLQWQGAGQDGVPAAGRGGLPMLMLTPAAGAAPDAVLDLAGRRYLVMDADTAGNRLGPVPAGWYDAALLVPAQRSLPAQRRVQVAAGQVTALAWQLRPDGQLTGLIAAEPGVLERPAGSTWAAGTAPRWTRITLTGPGVRRELRPQALAPADPYARLRDGQDDAQGHWFWFMGLPAGTYELAIESPDHPPHCSRHEVVPGRTGELRPLLLRPALPAAGRPDMACPATAAQTTGS